MAIHLARLWKRVSSEAVASDELEDLCRELVLELGVALLVTAWFVIVRALPFNSRPENFLIAAILIGGSVGAIRMRRANWRGALYLILGSLSGAIAIEAHVFPEGPARFYFPVVVIVSSLFVSRLSVFVIASLEGLICLAVARTNGAGWLDPNHVIAPMILIYVVAFASWLTSRQLRTALEWTRTSYANSLDLLERLREERGHLARTLKALEEAYVRIERMNTALVEARSAADEARRLKSQFAANISHELRTPLNLIIGFSETMANAPETYGDMEWPASLRGDIEEIYGSSRHLSSLIDDILDLSAADVHRLGLTLEEADIGEVVSGAVAVMGDLFAAKGLYLKTDLAPDLPRLRIDPTRIRQVLLNLLSNASRFTSEGGVVITVRRAVDGVRVAVADTGIGIAPRDVDKVFEEFRQIDGSASRVHGGTGLGVPLSRQLVELHGGRMWLESTPGKGSTFTFSLPVSPASTMPSPLPSAGAAPDALAPVALYPKTICALEPDPVLLRAMRRHMSTYDIVPVQAEGDLAAVVERHRPVALAVNCARGEPPALPAFGSLPVLAYTIRGGMGAAQELGVQAYLLKPIQRLPLLEAISALNKPVRDVLIVDDDPRMVDMLSRMLESAQEDYRPIKTFGGEEALARLQQSVPDLVLLDIVMPGVNGLDVLAAMRGSAALSQVPVIVISAEYPESSLAETGRSITVLRPDGFSVNQVFDCLQSLLGQLPLPDWPSTPGWAPS